MTDLSPGEKERAETLAEEKKNFNLEWESVERGGMASREKKHQKVPG